MEEAVLDYGSSLHQEDRLDWICRGTDVRFYSLRLTIP
jgi:hypothetical protein